MQIQFETVDGLNIAQAEVEIPDKILNHFPSFHTEKGSVLDLAHIRPGSFTRVMGDVSLRFREPYDKLTIPDGEYKGISVTQPTKDIRAILSTLGFQLRGTVSYWHPIFGEDSMSNWILFDINTDEISTLILRTYNKAWIKRGVIAKMLIEKALNDI